MQPLKKKKKKILAETKEEDVAGNCFFQLWNDNKHMTAITADHIAIKLWIFMKFRYKIGMLDLEHYWIAPSTLKNSFKAYRKETMYE